MQQIVVNSLVAAGIYALIGLSMSIIYLPTRFFHFAHGGVFAWGAYSGLFCVRALGLTAWAAALPAAVFATALGAGMELGVYRPLRGRGASRTVLLLSSLGLYVALQNLISLAFGDEVRLLGGPAMVQGVSAFGARVTRAQVGIIAAALVVTPTVHVFLRRSKFGRALRAVAADPELAMARGIDPNRVILGAFTLGSALVGLSAVLVGMDTNLTPTMGLGAMMTGSVVMIVGGVGSVAGILAASLLLSAAQQVGAMALGGQWQESVTLAVLLVALLARPGIRAGGQAGWGMTA
jgi:branched-chain amino acid transport system permease protein